jgi:hypothetical protein
MYKQVIYEHWLEWVPYVAFGVTFAVFISFVIRAVALNKDSAAKMAQIPLDD